MTSKKKEFVQLYKEEIKPDGTEVLHRNTITGYRFVHIYHVNRLSTNYFHCTALSCKHNVKIDFRCRHMRHIPKSECFDTALTKLITYMSVLQTHDDLNTIPNYLKKVVS